MSDIVERLRSDAVLEFNPRCRELMRDAASEITRLKAEVERLRGASKPCLTLLDDLMNESGKEIGYGEEDPFRMGEWFEDEDKLAIENLRAALATQEPRT
jgi:hypothetical protein